MRKTSITIIASFFAISAGCSDDPVGSVEDVSTEPGRHSAFGPKGSCTLTCEGEVYACERTDQGSCTKDAFTQLPRCLYELEWSVGNTCGGTSENSPGADAGQAGEGACTVTTCDGDVYACERTDESGCLKEAFSHLPRCLHDLQWSAGAKCDADPGRQPVPAGICTKPSTQCEGFSLGGPVNYAMNPCTPVLCKQPSDEEVQAQREYAQACQAAKGEVTECACGLSVCSVDVASVPRGSESQAKREELATKYPDIAEGSTKPENKKILCPFNRMLARAGFFDWEAKFSKLTVGIVKLAQAAQEFGVPFDDCLKVAAIASVNQLFHLATTPAAVNLEALHKAGALSHACGLTFAAGGTLVDDNARGKSLDKLKSRADKDGHLSLDDLKAVKLDVCEAPMSFAEDVELQLIYTFLGGKERGFIDFVDVERFLHAGLPMSIGAPGVIPQPAG